jgi:hypothetical protein
MHGIPMPIQMPMRMPEAEANASLGPEADDKADAMRKWGCLVPTSYKRCCIVSSLKIGL